MHDHFAAHFQDTRGEVGVDHKRNRADRAHVGRDVFAHGAVAARLGAHEHAAFVTQVHGKAIELELTVVDHVGSAFIQAQFLSHALIEGQRPLRREIGFCMNREHRHGVADLGEIASHLASDALRG